MSGDDQISFRDHFDARINDVVKHFDSRFNEIDKREIVNNDNVKLARENVELRLKELNEIRKMASDWAERFADKTAVIALDEKSQQRHKEILTKIESLTKEFDALTENHYRENVLKITNLEKYVSTLKGAIWILGGIGIFAGFVVPIVLKYLPVMLMRGP